MPAQRSERDGSGPSMIMLGFGTVGRCALPLLLGRLGIPASRYVVVDGEDQREAALPYIGAGVEYIVSPLRRENYARILSDLARPGDILVNLAVSVKCLDIAEWCQSHGVIYIDTAFEPWDDDIFEENEPVFQRTIYHYHHAARAMGARWRPGGPTAIFGHGANPGLATHFMKAALLEAARVVGDEAQAPATQTEWARLAMRLGVKVVHISERDTQSSPLPRAPREFVNTWSIVGFIEEASRPVELGWGTHETAYPSDAHFHEQGSKSCLYIPRSSQGFQLRSWVPRSGPIVGISLPHSETITISDCLTFKRGDEVIYRPTVAYVYLPCDAALASLHETMMLDWELPSAMRVMSTDIQSGADELGVLLLSERFGGLWYGSYLDIDAARKLVPHSNPTAVQVAAGVVSATVWSLKNGLEGYCEPEDLPFQEILETARPYLGSLRSTTTEWNPLKRRRILYGGSLLDERQPYVLGNFLV